MQLIATFKISGVNKVIAGKGKGTTIAQPGDLFVPYDDASGASLLADGCATKPGAVSIRADDGVEKPVVTNAAILGNDLLKAPAAKAATKKGAGKGKAAKPAADGTPAAGSLDDLGLGEDDGQDEVIE